MEPFFWALLQSERAGLNLAIEWLLRPLVPSAMRKLSFVAGVDMRPCVYVGQESWLCYGVLAGKILSTSIPATCTIGNRAVLLIDMKGKMENLGIVQCLGCRTQQLSVCLPFGSR